MCVLVGIFYITQKFSNHHTYADTSSNYNLRSKASGQETLTSFKGDNLANMFGNDYFFKSKIVVVLRVK